MQWVTTGRYVLANKFFITANCCDIRWQDAVSGMCLSHLLLAWPHVSCMSYQGRVIVWCRLVDLTRWIVLHCAALNVIDLSKLALKVWEKIKCICIFCRFWKKREHSQLKSLLMENKDPLIICSPYHSCWWPSRSTSMVLKVNPQTTW